MSEISFILVSWNVRDLLRRALAALLADSADIKSEIIVVDNDSHDGTPEMVRAEFPNVRLIANSENVGFTRGNNQALALARGRYFFFINPDTEIVTGATRALLDFMDANPRVGIAGPQLLNPDHSVQPSRRSFPTFATALFETPRLSRSFPRNRWLTRYYLRDTRDDKRQDVDWITGAAMFVRREVYEQVGGLDENFFMYSEELDWCRRAKQAGWRVVYFPRAQVIHHEGKSSEQVIAARDVYYYSSKVRYFRKYHGWLRSQLLRAFFLAMFANQLVQESGKWLLGHKRSLRAARVKAYVQVLQSGLK